MGSALGLGYPKEAEETKAASSNLPSTEPSTGREGPRQITVPPPPSQTRKPSEREGLPKSLSRQDRAGESPGPHHLTSDLEHEACGPVIQVAFSLELAVGWGDSSTS